MKPKLPLGANVAPMFGHSAWRAHVMGLERSLTVQPSETELKTMQQIAAGAWDAGFIGISIDMFYWQRMSGEWRGCTIPSQADRFPVQELHTVTKETGFFYWVSPSATK